MLAIAATAPDLDQLKPSDKGQSSVIFAADGSRLGYVQSDVVRTRDPVGATSRPCCAAPRSRSRTSASTSTRAWTTTRSCAPASRNLESGENLQGGSTITQQLVRALYIKDPKRNFTRKIREAKLASELEDEHSKTWILHNYLNDIPYGTVGGRTAIGVEAAAVDLLLEARRSELDLTEAAALAGLPQAPSQYNPFRNPAAALERRNEVLDRMADNGYITRGEADARRPAPLGLKHGTRYTTPARALLLRLRPGAADREVRRGRRSAAAG